MKIMRAICFALTLLIGVVPAQVVDASVTNGVNYSWVAQPHVHIITQHDRVELKCLADNAYFEARNQSIIGMMAVDDVVMNRMRGDPSRFGKTPCDVIYRRDKDGCQFSWVCQRHVVRDTQIYAAAEVVARVVFFTSNIVDYSAGATYYHSVDVHPYWSKHFRMTAAIGDHIFYKDPKDESYSS